MARTLSVPQRGSIAAIGGSGSRVAGPALALSAGRNLGQRGTFLALAVLMTGTGALLPHLDSEVLANVLFLAGAGLAALVVMMPWQLMSRKDADAVKAARQPNLPTAFAPETGRQLRFPEILGSNSTAQPSLDRAAWAKLTAHMSHELRTPLNAVLGFSEIMTSEVFGPLGSSYSSYARDIHTSGRILLKSAEDALAITALLTASDRKRSRETTLLKSVIDDACSFAAPDLAARSITVAIDASRDAEIIGDHQAVRQMLINLIAETSRNAAPGAVIRIAAKSYGEAVDLTVTVSAGGAITAPSEDGFGIILARTLCELSGAELAMTGTAGHGECGWTVRMLRAVQPDLFAAA